jgi:hypothetical protein
LRLETGNVRTFDPFVGNVRAGLAELGGERFDYLVNNAGTWDGVEQDELGRTTQSGASVLRGLAGHRGRRGRGRAVPRLGSGSRPARRVDALLPAPAPRAQPWQPWRVKDGDKGPMVWECKHRFLTTQDENGLPGARVHLLIARNVLDREEIKFFVSNAPPPTAIGALLLVACARWRVERCLEDDKGELGLDK